jgi:hypothetical protein
MSLNDLKIGKPDLGSYTCEINMEMQRWVVSEEELYLHTIDNGDGIGCSAEEPHQHHDQADDRRAGSSSASLTRTRKVTASLPSTMRWS